MKVNDEKLRSKLVSEDSKLSKVMGVQCWFYFTFGRQEKADAKQKVSSSVQA